MKRYIKTNIDDFLNEQLLKENIGNTLDLSDRDNVIKWLEDGNSPENIYDEESSELDCVC